MIKGAVLGYPVTHSLSPLLHESAYRFLGLDGSYEAIEVNSGELAQFFDERGFEFDYFSLTMPLKEELLTLNLEISEIAKKSHSGNTLYRADESWKITSTDGIGFLNSLRNIEFAEFDSVLILGAGGTARAIAAALDGVAQSITIMGRTSTRRDSFESIIVESEFEYIRWIDSHSLDRYTLIVNTTPAGAADLLAESIDYQITALLFDVIYKPWPTVLAKKWRDKGLPVLSGTELLIYQGIEQLRIATRADFSEQELAVYLRKILAEAS